MAGISGKLKYITKMPSHKSKVLLQLLDTDKRAENLAAMRLTMRYDPVKIQKLLSLCDTPRELRQDGVKRKINLKHFLAEFLSSQKAREVFGFTEPLIKISKMSRLQSQDTEGKSAVALPSIATRSPSLLHA